MRTTKWAVILGGILTTAICNAATIQVPSDYPTIQAAINAASANDTIQVAAGTYNEAIDINKPLTLLGAQANVEPSNSGRAGGESIIDSSYAVIIHASDVVFNGFEVRNFRFGVNIPGPFPAPEYKRSNIRIAYNWLHSAATVVTVGINAEPGLLQNWVITHNIIDLNDSDNDPNTYALAAIGLSSSTSVDGLPTYESVEISFNDLQNLSGGYNLFSGADPALYRINGMTIRGNYFHDAGVNYNIGNIRNGEFSGNLVEDIGGSVGIATGIISGNEFRNGGYLNLWGTRYGFWLPSQDLQIHNNDFTDQIYGRGLTLDIGALANTIHVNTNAFRESGIAPSGTPTTSGIGYLIRNLTDLTVDATNNWWGNATGPTGNTGGLYGPMTTSPWITAYIDNPSTLVTPTDWPLSTLLSELPGFWPLIAAEWRASCLFSGGPKSDLYCQAVATYCQYGGNGLCSPASILVVRCNDGTRITDQNADARLQTNHLFVDGRDHASSAILEILDFSAAQSRHRATLLLRSPKGNRERLRGACTLGVSAIGP